MTTLVSQDWFGKFLRDVRADKISAATRDEAVLHLGTLLADTNFSAKECAELLIRVPSEIVGMTLKTKWLAIHLERRAGLLNQIVLRQTTGNVIRAAARIARVLLGLDTDGAKRLLCFATEDLARNSPAGGLLGDLRPFCTTENYQTVSEIVMTQMEFKQRLLLAAALVAASGVTHKRPLGSQQILVLVNAFVALATQSSSDMIPPWAFPAIEQELQKLPPADKERAIREVSQLRIKMSTDSSDVPKKTIVIAGTDLSVAPNEGGVPTDIPKSSATGLSNVRERQQNGKSTQEFAGILRAWVEKRNAEWSEELVFFKEAQNATELSNSKIRKLEDQLNKTKLRESDLAAELALAKQGLEQEQEKTVRLEHQVATAEQTAVHSCEQRDSFERELIRVRAELGELRRTTSDQVARLGKEVNANADRVLSEFKNRLAHEVVRRIPNIPAPDIEPQKEEGRLFLFQLHQLIDLFDASGINVQALRGNV